MNLGSQKHVLSLSILLSKSTKVHTYPAFWPLVKDIKWASSPALDCLGYEVLKKVLFFFISFLKIAQVLDQASYIIHQ